MQMSSFVNVHLAPDEHHQVLAFFLDVIRVKEAIVLQARDLLVQVLVTFHIRAMDAIPAVNFQRCVLRKIKPVCNFANISIEAIAQRNIFTSWNQATNEDEALFRHIDR